MKKIELISTIQKQTIEEKLEVLRNKINEIIEYLEEKE